MRYILIFIPFIIRGTNALRPLPLLQYDMTTDDCQRLMFLNRGILGEESLKLIRNISTTACTIGYGIESDFMNNGDEPEESKALYSSAPIGSFLDELIHDTISDKDEKGLTFSFWIRPVDIHDNIRKSTDDHHQINLSRNVFTIGWNMFSADARPQTGFTLCETLKLDFQLSIVDKDLFEILYRTSNHAFEPCQRLKFNVSSIYDFSDGPQSYSRPMHLAITLGNYHQEVFLNGRALARKREAFDVDLKHWNPMSNLEFFPQAASEYHKSYPWGGQLFQFSIYNGVLNKNQVRSVISEGLCPSQPVAHSSLTHIDEDALDENGALEQIQMPYSFLDDEIDSLLSSLDLPHQPAANVRHYITRFPTRGYLFHIKDQRIIEPNEKYPVFVRDMDRLIYMPRKDEHSDFLGRAYASFDYCVTTNKIIMSSQCTTATISVVVNPINDPPIAIMPPTYYVHEGIQRKARALLLTGSDIDENDFIQTVQITSPPRLGYLSLSVSSFRNDNLLHGTILSTHNHTIPGKEIYVEYQFTDFNTTTIQGTLVMDFFRFRVQDSVGSWSSEVEVKIQILSGVFSLSDNHYKWTVPMVKAGGGSSQLKGIDKSGLNRTLGFLIVALPSKGSILDEGGAKLSTDAIIKPTETLFVGDDNLARLNLTYVGSQSTCNENDHLLVSDVLQYQVVALDSDMETMSVSAVAKEEISVVCRVEPVHIQVINGEGGKNVSTFVSSADDVCSGYMFDFTEESNIKCHGTTFIFGIRASNTEILPEPVYVMIKTDSGGFLSLNQNQVSNIDTFFDQSIMRSSVRFLVSPERLNAILSAIHFQSHASGKYAIHISLQYGRCSHNYTFLMDNEYSKFAKECFKTQTKIDVNVLPNPYTLGSPCHPFPWIPLLIVAVSGAVFYMKGKAQRAIEMIYEEWKDQSTFDNKNICFLENMLK